MTTVPHHTTSALSLTSFAVLARPLDPEWIVLTQSLSGLTDIVNDSRGVASCPRDFATNSPATPSTPALYGGRIAPHTRLENSREKDLDE